MSKTATISLASNSPAEIVPVIEAILGSNPYAKQQGKNLLQTAREKDFNGYIHSITTTLKETPELKIKIFCLAHLRKQISAFIQEDDKGWVDLQSNTQKLIKETLLAMLKGDQYQGAKVVVSEFVGDLASTIQNAGRINKRFSQEATEWNELKQVLSESLTSGNAGMINCCLIILSVILSGEPDFVAKNDKQLLDMLKALDKNTNDIQLKHRVLATIVLMMETFPNKFAKKSEAIKENVELLLNFMISLIEEPSAEWLDPPEDFSEETSKATDPLGERFFNCLSFLNKIVQALPGKTTLAVMHQLINQMLVAQDWRYVYCGLLCFCQLVEYTEDTSNLDHIMNPLAKYLEHQHPKVRYAVLHCIGQCSEDARPAFQERYGIGLLQLINKAYTDKTPRVVYHAVNCTVNFVEGCPEEILDPMVPQIVNTLLGFVEKGKPYLKENAISALATLCEERWPVFQPYFKNTYDIILGELNKATDYMKDMKGQSIEALTIMGRAAGREEFAKVCEPLIVKMLQFQMKQTGLKKLDVLSTYLVSSWGRICYVLKEDFEPYAISVMPTAFLLAENMCELQKKREDEFLGDEDEAAIVAKNVGPEGQEINSVDDDQNFFAKNDTPMDQDTNAIMNMMVNFFKCGIKPATVQYIETAVHIIIQLISDDYEDRVHRIAVRGLKDIIKIVYESDLSSKQEFLTRLSLMWLESIKDTDELGIESDIKKNFFAVMTELVFKAGKVLTEDQLNLLIKCASNALKESQKNLLALVEAGKDEEDEDEEAEDGDDEEGEKEAPYEIEERTQCIISDLMGALFKVYKEQTLSLVKEINTEVLPKGLKPDVPPTLTKVALFFIDNIIEYLGVEYIPEELPQYAQTLIKYTTDSNSGLRNAAVYGLGILSESGAEMFKDVQEDCLKAMYESLLLKKDDDDSPEDFEHCNDNVIATIGKIMKNHQHNLADLKKAVQVWLGHLPLKADKGEAKKQHDQLVDTLLGPDASLVLGQNNENLQKIVQVIGEVINTKLVNQEFNRKAIEAIGFLKGNEATKVLVEQAISSLPVKVKNNLKEASQKINLHDD